MWWCVTERQGLYVYEYKEQEDADEEFLETNLSRVGCLSSVQWSGVYTVEGQHKNVFKVSVKIGQGAGGGVGTPEIKMYVLSEDNFKDFSDTTWRSTALDERVEEPCRNVDVKLVQAHASHVSTESTGGKWFKNWFTSVSGTDPDKTPQLPGPAKPVLPNVFGNSNIAGPPVASSSSSQEVQYAINLVKLSDPTYVQSLLDLGMHIVCVVNAMNACEMNH